jgi:lysophospholipase L1-like esterase
VTDASAKPPRWKRLAQNLALSLGVFLLCLGGLELVLRLNGYGNLEIYEPDASLYWKLKPNQNCYTKIDHKQVHINSQGTRGPEFQLQKPPHTFRILSLGDSRTFGWGLSAEETYSGILQALLQKQAGEAKTIEVINAGVNAWSYPQMLVYFRDTALRYDPDIVILAEANLWTQFSEKNSPEFVKKFMGRVRFKNFLRHFALYHYVVEVKLRDFYQHHRTKFIPIDPQQDALFKEQQQSEPEALFAGAIEDLCRLAQDRGSKPVLLFLPALDEAGTTNSPAVLRLKRDISRKLSLPLVDLTPAVQAGGKKLYLEADPVHFNHAGNENIARQLFDIVSPLAAR